MQTQIVRQNINSQVVDYLQSNIKNHEWLIGDKIPSENQLTEILNVSRSSIRTAISELIGLGVLESKHGKGTFVKSDDLDVLSSKNRNITKADCKDISKVLEIRKILEPESCKIAVEYATEETINSLKNYLEEMKKSVGNPKNYIQADMNFHKVISHATQNNLIEKTINDIFEQTEYTHTQMNNLFGFDGIYYHELILKAIIKHDSTRASKYMKEHLQHAIDKI